MDKVKPVVTPLGTHFRLTREQSPKTEEYDYMNKVPYASAIGFMMYALICMRPDVAHTVGVVSRFMSNLRKKHWEVVMWILRYLKGFSYTCHCL